MTQLSENDIVVVVAAIDARATVQASLAAFLAETADRGEVVLVDASRDGTADEALARFPELRVLRRPPGSLAPELWRDGLEATRASLVAFSTAQMVPRPGWLRALLDRLDASRAAAVGGAIAPGGDLAPVDRALYLLRYANYLPPVPAFAAFDPPGDNALYRRDRLRGLEPCWRQGFWEVEIHRQLRQRGERLATAPEAIIEYRGGCRLAPALAQRHAHGRRYGAGRSSGRGWGYRLTRSAAAPAVPAVLLGRILRA
ncbi:MAG: glycosyltransferase, partial [Isosphaeraceae bacterium]|nr:glycosyltransferase [Isosphaeraceae bacterium]